MLTRLSLKNFVIVKSLELDVSAGFTVLTGETGAGKSILLDALGLLLGDRADAGVVAQGADKADISAEFMSSASLAAWLDAADLNSDEDTILVRRVIDAQGNILPGAKLGLGETGVIDARLPPARPPTLYNLIGESAFAMMLLISAVTMVWGRYRRASRN